MKYLWPRSGKPEQTTQVPSFHMVCITNLGQYSFIYKIVFLYNIATLLSTVT